jgi:hypothetical protein
MHRDARKGMKMPLKLAAFGSEMAARIMVKCVKLTEVCLRRRHHGPQRYAFRKVSTIQRFLLALNNHKFP